MNVYSLSNKFYVIFVLATLLPASLIADFLSAQVSIWAPEGYFQDLMSLGLIEVPTTVIIILFALWLTVEYLWKIKIIRACFRIPNINGRYDGFLESSFDSQTKYPVAIEVKQSLTKLSVNLYTQNSSSYSLIANIGKNNLGNWSVFYIFQNTTNTVNENEDMRDHNGTCFLEISDNCKELNGHYYNNPRDRGRHGSIKVEWSSNKLKGHI